MLKNGICTHYNKPSIPNWKELMYTEKYFLVAFHLFFCLAGAWEPGKEMDQKHTCNLQNNEWKMMKVMENLKPL